MQSTTDKRFSPRVGIELQTVVEMADNRQLNVTTFNLSQKGIGVICNTMIRNLITPGGSFIQGLHPLELGVSIDVAEFELGTSRIEAVCQVIYSRRIAKDKCQIGLQFKEMDSASKAILQEIIQSIVSANRPQGRQVLEK